MILIGLTNIEGLIVITYEAQFLIDRLGLVLFVYKNRMKIAFTIALVSSLNQGIAYHWLFLLLLGGRAIVSSIWPFI